MTKIKIQNQAAYAKLLSCTKKTKGNTPVPLARNIFIGSIFLLTQITFTLYLPTLPKLSKVFLVSQNQVFFSLTTSFVGYLIGHLFWGTASDYLGRKKLILISLGTYALVQFTISQINDYSLFLCCFAVAGFTAAAYTSIGNALLKDLFHEKAKKAIALTGIVMAAGPAIGTYLGAHLSYWFSWRAVYTFLSCYAITSLLSLSFLLKTEPPGSRSKHDKATYALKAIILNQQYLGEVIPLALIFGVLFGYLGASPFIYMEYFHLSIHQYAYVSFFTTITAAVGSAINAKLLKKRTPQWISTQGLSLATISLGLILLLTLLKITYIVLFIFLFALLMLGSGMTLPSCKAGAMMVFDKNIGMASSIMKFIQTAGGIGVTGLGANLYNKDNISGIIVLFTATCIAALASALLLRKNNSL